MLLAMRRNIVIFLMFLLPLQFSWEAVSAYCEHEQEIASDHVGHHAHQHQSKDVSKSDTSDQFKPGDFDADCGVCHASCLVALTDAMLSLHCITTNVSFAFLQVRYVASFPAKPERPKWLDLA